MQVSRPRRPQPRARAPLGECRHPATLTHSGPATSRLQAPPGLRLSSEPTHSHTLQRQGWAETRHFPSDCGTINSPPTKEASLYPLILSLSPSPSPSLFLSPPHSRPPILSFLLSLLLCLCVSQR